MSRVESEGASPTGPESKRSASGKGCQPSSPNRLPFPSLPFRPLPAPSCRASPRRLLTRHCMSRLERPGRLAASRVGAVAPSAAGHCGTHPPGQHSRTKDPPQVFSQSSIFPSSRSSPPTTLDTPLTSSPPTPPGSAGTGCPPASMRPAWRPDPRTARPMTSRPTTRKIPDARPSSARSRSREPTRCSRPDRTSR